MPEESVVSRAERQESAGTSELSAILSVLTELQRGNASVRLPAEWTGMFGKIAETFNDVVEQNERMYGELERLSRVVGREGKLNKRASVGYVRGFWRDSIECVNGLIDDLVHPTTETARVIGAVAQGDLGQTMALRSMTGHCRESSCAPQRPSTRWSINSARSPQRLRGSRAKWAPRASSAARPK